MRAKTVERKAKGLRGSYQDHGAYLKILKRKALEALGGASCVNCKCAVLEVLQINHVNGAGNIERKKTGYTKNYKQFYRDLISGKLDRSKYDVRCFVCNVLHYVESKGITGHKVIWNAPITQLAE